MYMSAVKYYISHDFGKAREEFLKVNEKIPGYRFTQGYLNRIDRELALKPAVVVTAPAAVVKIPAAPPLFAPTGALGIENQQKQVRDISALAEKSARLYRQIAGVADDRSIAQTKRKMAEVNRILNNLKEREERLLHQMREEQWKRRQEERRAEAEKMYQMGGNIYVHMIIQKPRLNFWHWKKLPLIIKPRVVI